MARDAPARCLAVRCLIVLALASLVAGCPKKDPGQRALDRAADARPASRSKRPVPEIPERGPLAQKVLYEQAKGLLVAGRAAQAVPVFRQAILAHAAGPSLANCHLGLGSALADLGRHGEAVSAFERVVKLRPGDPEARRALAIGLEEAGRIDEAQRSLRQALVLDPLLLSVYQDLATLQLRQKDDAGARATYATYEKKRLELLGRIIGKPAQVDVRLDALGRLAEARDEKTAQTLAGRLAVERPGRVRLAMIRALAAQGQALALEPLRALRSRAGSAEERRAIDVALGVLGAAKPAATGANVP